jgi:hypothetical protein
MNLITFLYRVGGIIMMYGGGAFIATQNPALVVIGVLYGIAGLSCIEVAINEEKNEEKEGA